jgi:hypothetical protein
LVVDSSIGSLVDSLVDSSIGSLVDSLVDSSIGSLVDSLGGSSIVAAVLLADVGRGLVVVDSAIAVAMAALASIGSFLELAVAGSLALH